MTPLDFLQSLTSEKPRFKERKTLSTKEVKTLLASTPPLKSASSNLFQSLGNRGLLSYADYLFLLCILTKPQHGFKIAFKMFDTDGNEQVDKAEFIKLQQIFRKSRDNRKSNFQYNEEIYLDEFCQFFVFLNLLDDFETAVQMYTRSGIPIGKDEFARVVFVLTGRHLPSSIVSAIFSAFDPVGLGHLRLHDFVSAMRQRILRGHKDKGHLDNLAFFPCVRRELSKYQC
uniref:EF-hand domain-containing protein n=1 Tax=Eptatretus burgeri TaxID=7764 RepID=A0A8C4Q9C1_EPTBU